METKEMKIQVPEGYEIDKEKSTFEKIVFKKVENELPKSWEDLGVIRGFYVNAHSEARDFECCTNKDSNKNTFPTKKEAEACLALAQLCQLRDRYNDGWKPNWKDDNQFKWCIDFFQDVVRKTAVLFVRRTLTFKTEELRDKFLENFRDLIETAKPLL
nr:MAG TPA: hypothetical protein [Caudoviricetes sp.]